MADRIIHLSLRIPCQFTCLPFAWFSNNSAGVRNSFRVVFYGYLHLKGSGETSHRLKPTLSHMKKTTLLSFAFTSLFSFTAQADRNEGTIQLNRQQKTEVTTSRQFGHITPQKPRNYSRAERKLADVVVYAQPERKTKKAIKKQKRKAVKLQRVFQVSTSPDAL